MKIQDKKISTHHKRILVSMFNNAKGQPVTLDYVGKVLTGKRHNKAMTDAYAILLKAESQTTENLKTRIEKFQSATI